MMLPDSVVHEGGLHAVGPEGFYPFFDRLSAALSNIHATVEDTMCDGDKICVRWTFIATHTGEGLGIPPSGVTFCITGITIMRAANGKLLEGWQNWDMLGMMQQIEGGRHAATYVGA